MSDQNSLVVFDLYGTVLDLDGLIEPLSEFTKMPEAVRDMWRQRQLQMANAAVASGRYVDFDRLTLIALYELMPRFHMRLGAAEQKHLLDAWAKLPAFPDVVPALQVLEKRGIPMAVLSNAVLTTARNAVAFAELDGFMKYIFGSDTVQAFKPKHEMYEQTATTGVEASNTAFVSAHDWDATGARQAGFATIFINRKRGGQPTHKPERTIDDLSALPRALRDLGLATV